MTRQPVNALTATPAANWGVRRVCSRCCLCMSQSALAAAPGVRRLPERTVTDVVVVDWGMRSITALPVPVMINTLPASALRWLPGIGKKKMAAVIAKRPFRDLEAYRNVAGKSAIDSVLGF